MNRVKKRKTKLLWGGVLLATVLLGGREVGAKIYSVQVGAYQVKQNAENQFSLLKKSVPLDLQDHLRIEKTGKGYKVKIGKTEDPEKALNLLLALRPYSPDAFVVPDQERVTIITKTKDEPARSFNPPTRKKKGPIALKQKEPVSVEKPESTLPLGKAEILGTISEISSIASDQVGLPPGKSIYRLLIWVEATKGDSGAPDFLKERTGEFLTVFSETRTPALQAGNKIRATVEYKGNQYSSFYWIIKPQIVGP
jgi:hypothetical protein